MASWARADLRGAFAEQLAQRAREIAVGAEPIGWKIGVAGEAARAAAGTDAPLVGYLLSSGRLEPGATVSVAGWAAPFLEPELAVYLRSEVRAGVALDDARAAIGSVSLAFELVDIDAPLTDAPGMLRRNVFQRAVVLGPRVAAESVPSPIAVLVGDEVVAETADPIAATGDHAALVQHVADVLGAAGETLRAGEVVITGTVVPPLRLAPGSYVMRAAGLGELRLTVTDETAPASAP